MQYLVDNKHAYSFSYKELQSDYYRYLDMTDVEFVEHISELLHFVCFVCFLKEVPAGQILSDKGLLHQLIHLQNEDTKQQALNDLQEIRTKFDVICNLP